MVDTIESLCARVAELEAQLAAAPVRRTRKPAQPECQYCGDVKADKVSFMGLALCAEWRPCASRIRSNQRKGIILTPARLRVAA